MNASKQAEGGEGRYWRMEGRMRPARETPKKNEMINKIFEMRGGRECEHTVLLENEMGKAFESRTPHDLQKSAL